MAKDVVELKGFNELQAKIKLLPDKVKRKELLKILGQAANSTVKAARLAAPRSNKKHVISGKGRLPKVIQPGNLKKSIGKIKSKRNKENAVLYVGPRSHGRKHDGWYGAIVHGGRNIYKTGFKRSHKSGADNSRGAKSRVAPNEFMSRAYQITKGQVSNEAEAKVAKYIQKQIDRLSESGVI